MDSSGPLSPSDDAPGSEIRVKVKQLKAPLHAKTVAIEHLAKRMPNGSWTHRKINHIVEDLTCPIIVGINPAERLERQNVVVNLSVDTGDQGLERGYWLDFRNLIKVLYEVCRIFFFFRRNMSKSLFNRICQCQTSRRLRR
jgi:dihydroneopterin aldolase/2-amino-4-hydroxy-6-hydroxymethyldihydropteridine diphosphokinase/dihydropteroate synthase